MLYRQIRCFLEVANTLSFTTAAQNLYMTQQAVTKQISALEKDLGVKLFHRTTRSVSLTTAGQVLRDDFTDIHRQIKASVKKVQSLAKGKKDTVSIGFLSALSRQRLVVPIADALFQAYPDTFFDLRLLNFVELRNQLQDHKLDLCVTTSNDWQFWPSVQVKVLQSKQFEIVYSSRHPLAQQEPFSLEALQDYVQLTLPSENILPGVEFWGKKIPCCQAIQCPDIPTLLVRLESGQGFSLLTRVFEGFESPTLRYQEVPFPEAHAEIVCICREDADEDTTQIVKTIWQHFKTG